MVAAAAALKVTKPTPAAAFVRGKVAVEETSKLASARVTTPLGS